jgi:prepilin-type N-terminal cleavage/methylation domain-containing protein
MSHAAERANRGFTILELLITLLVITLTATFSIWAYFSRAEITLVRAAQLLVEDLRMAQMRAACNHTQVDVVFDRAEGCYHVVGVDDPVLPSATTPRCYPVDAVFEGVRISDDNLGRPALIRFDARGRVAYTARVTLSYRGDSRTVLIPVDDGCAVLVDGPAR